ncbi:hypothetical protein ACS77P_19930 [Yersinia enterocolitica]|uniref:hypothetical protein n=1 Tax=Yersinia enterocolitica TaxID=630 RepID=UPI003F43F8B2
MSIFLTVISGVMIFVIGQFILKLVLEPIISFKEHLGMTSALFLKEQGKITNGIDEESIIKEIKTLAALLLAKKKRSHIIILWLIISASLHQKTLCLPLKK